MPYLFLSTFCSRTLWVCVFAIEGCVGFVFGQVDRDTTTDKKRWSLGTRSCESVFLLRCVVLCFLFYLFRLALPFFLPLLVHPMYLHPRLLRLLLIKFRRKVRLLHHQTPRLVPILLHHQIRSPLPAARSRTYIPLHTMVLQSVITYPEDYHIHPHAPNPPPPLLPPCGPPACPLKESINTLPAYRSHSTLLRNKRLRFASFSIRGQLELSIRKQCRDP